MQVKLNPLEKPIAWLLKKGSDTRLAKHAGDKVFANDRKFIDGLGVASIIAKDGLGCYLYVTQSLNNKEIPDDKRKFVAALDLTNGVLMIAFQLLMFFTVSHKVCQTKMFDKFFGKMFDRPIQKTYRAITKKEPMFKDVGDMQFSEDFIKIRNNVKDAFGGLTSLAAATIVGKRMLVPFVATPLADKVKDKMEAYEAKKNGTKPAEVQADNSNPSMQGAPKSEQPVQTAQVYTPTFDTGSTNLLDKFKK